ncbi:penicillin-insensitive murein endopeptidase [Aestuariivirga sp.]|uniref:penicillin-insensitive murein endopeptidase n=1 Tax=Aestuariivirga sp. TaxID=2650926 RepID=UPI0039E2513E
MLLRHALPLIAMLLVCAAPAARADDAQAATPTAVDPALLRMPAKKLFGAEKLPTQTKAQAIGFYAKGCLAGAEQLPITGNAWQVMRLSRNRNWDHPAMVSLVEQLAEDAKKYDGWNGLLVGDMAQPRGGPMVSGHASHQVGLDADIWLTPMPDHVLTAQERETMVPKEMVKNNKQINPANFGEAQMRLLKRAASYPQVARIFVHPPIKAALCQWATGDRAWLAKIRPYFGHTFHFHMRINCPAGSPFCKNQPPARPADGTGCGTELAYWMGDIPWKKPKPNPNAPPPKPAPPLTLAGLPAECRAVVTAP